MANDNAEVKVLNTEIKHFELIDVFFERYISLRKIFEKLWNEYSNIPISNSEWQILSIIYNKQPTLSYVSKNVDISRQATHKLIKKLESKGLVQVMNVKNNNKEKCLSLTPLGIDCYEKSEILKASLENRIAEKLGSHQVEALANILKSDWGLEPDLLKPKYE